VFHGHDHAARARYQIHSAAHPLDHFAGNHPVGDVAFFVHFHGAEYAEVDVAAADHSKGFRAGEKGRTRHLADGFFAGVDQVGVLLALDRVRADAQHAILTLQNDLHAGRNMVGDEGRHTNAQIDVESVAQFASDALDDALALIVILAGFCRSCHLALLPSCARPDGRGARPYVVQLAFLTVLLSIRFSYSSPWKMRCTKTLGV
jgi:hypothetical protein